MSYVLSDSEELSMDGWSSSILSFFLIDQKLRSSGLMELVSTDIEAFDLPVVTSRVIDDGLVCPPLKRGKSRFVEAEDRLRDFENEREECRCFLSHCKKKGIQTQCQIFKGSSVCDNFICQSIVKG